jgi:hypothetical protein
MLARCAGGHPKPVHAAVALGRIWGE